MFVSRLTIRSVSASLVVLALVGLALLPAITVTAQDSPSAVTWILNSTNGHEYAILEDCAGWHACESAAVIEGAHLVTVNDAAEQAWLVTQFGGTEHYWIGLSDEVVMGDWVWTSGEAFSYTNWHLGEPTHSGGTERYVLMNWALPGEWNDGHSLASTIALVERPAAPEPTATQTTIATATPSSTIHPTITASPTNTVTPTATGIVTGVPLPVYHVFLTCIFRQDQNLLPGN